MNQKCSVDIVSVVNDNSPESQWKIVFANVIYQNIASKLLTSPSVEYAGFCLWTRVLHMESELTHLKCL